MDKQLIAERFSKAIATYPQEANVQRQIADKMIHLLTKHISFPCSKVIEFGCGTYLFPYATSGPSAERIIAKRPLPGNEVLLRGYIKKRTGFLSSGRCRDSSFPR